jgi:hypothetical protein
MVPRTTCRLSLEHLEDRLTPSGLPGGPTSMPQGLFSHFLSANVSVAGPQHANPPGFERFEDRWTSPGLVGSWFSPPSGLFSRIIIFVNGDGLDVHTGGSVSSSTGVNLNLSEPIVAGGNLSLSGTGVDLGVAFGTSAVSGQIDLHAGQSPSPSPGQPSSSTPAALLPTPSAQPLSMSGQSPGSSATPAATTNSNTPATTVTAQGAQFGNFTSSARQLAVLAGSSAAEATSSNPVALSSESVLLPVANLTPPVPVTALKPPPPITTPASGGNEGQRVPNKEVGEPADSAASLPPPTDAEEWEGVDLALMAPPTNADETLESTTVSEWLDEAGMASPGHLLLLGVVAAGSLGAAWLAWRRESEEQEEADLSEAVAPLLGSPL